MKRVFFILTLAAMSHTSFSQESDAFKTTQLLEELAKSEKSYLRFFDNETLSSGIYQLKAGEKDEQEPHQWDELYYVLEGKAHLKAGDKIYEATPGAILFVKAQVVHQFVDIKEDLKILVFFSKKDQ